MSVYRTIGPLVLYKSWVEGGIHFTDMFSWLEHPALWCTMHFRQVELVVNLHNLSLVSGLRIILKLIVSTKTCLCNIKRLMVLQMKFIILFFRTLIVGTH